MNLSNVKVLIIITTLFFLTISCSKSNNGDTDFTYPGTDLVPVRISGTVWAPVNAGYVAVSSPYGLLFQWGRMYGQEYVSTNTFAGPIDIGSGNNAANSANFYTIYSDPFDWCTPQITTWNMDLYNPCPSGWRVPAADELIALNNAGSTWIDIGGDSPDGLSGRWFGGKHDGTHSGSIFLPASGYRNVVMGAAEIRSYIGDYWSGNATGTYSSSLYFSVSGTNIASDYRAGGLSVRCVKK